METPVFGWFRDVASYGGHESNFTGWRFASFTPSFSAMIVLTPR
jgi:hypothetical protein